MGKELCIRNNMYILTVGNIDITDKRTQAELAKRIQSFVTQEHFEIKEIVEAMKTLKQNRIYEIPVFYQVVEEDIWGDIITFHYPYIEFNEL